MTRKDFELIARVIRQLREDSEDWEVETLDIISDRLAKEFKQVNPNFDKSKFLEACDAK